ncbi:MAG: Holliday junction resolvase RuvX [Clostridia bacterium]|nr:Holliday junction resolvase RuvX [Clostridia bacterium]
MKMMGIDLGKVRTGVCVSDLSGFLAGRSVTVTANSRAELIERICRMIEAERPGRVVVGLPLNMNGTEGEKARECRAFAALLQEKSGVPAVLWDERGSSVTANRILSDAGKKRNRQRAKVDAVAAQVILQNYLDYWQLHKQEEARQSRGEE